MPTKYRILYAVVEELDSKRIDAARREMDRRSDDLDEYCNAAIHTQNVKAELQEWVTVKGIGGFWQAVKETP